MAKGTGLIGNFKGKVGNTVGYKLSASNNGQTQGIRVYQPIVKNPKTAAQAEQRAKLLAVNATYRALKMVIDRGNEGLPYGNKSRLAWLKGALMAQTMPWYKKGANPSLPVICPVTKGSLAGIQYSIGDDSVHLVCMGVTSATSVATIGAVSTALLAGNTQLKEGDQITFVFGVVAEGAIAFDVQSIILNKTSAEATDMFSATDDELIIQPSNFNGVFTVIVSREGANGEHLRSTSSLSIAATYVAQAPYDATSKAAAIASYQASAATNSDWAEESIQ